jgi:hypothetical protein
MAKSKSKETKENVKETKKSSSKKTSTKRKEIVEQTIVNPEEIVEHNLQEITEYPSIDKNETKDELTENKSVPKESKRKIKMGIEKTILKDI